MELDKPIGGEFAALLPALADTMRYATQALAQSAAVYEVMISKGIATKEEMENALGSAMPGPDAFLATLDRGWQQN